jgi:hypothetical protein
LRNQTGIKGSSRAHQGLIQGSSRAHQGLIKGASRRIQWHLPIKLGELGEEDGARGHVEAHREGFRREEKLDEVLLEEGE